MCFEVRAIREITIDLHSLPKMDNKYYFYYDETNNLRKYHLKNESLNASINTNFVLGGVVHEENATDHDYHHLVNEINLQKSAKEMKFKHVAKGSFLKCLDSRKLKVFLDWILDSDLYIHYFVLNLFYFSIVDIVDSAIANSDIAQQLGMEFANEMKSDLYTIAKFNEEQFIQLLVSYNYPNLQKENISDFINDLTCYIRNYEDIPELHIGLVSLRQILKDSITNNELAFLENNEDSILIGDFMQFYMQPVYMFINSKHEFDEESSVFAAIEKMNFTYNNQRISNYKQVKSEESDLVQVSDVVVGLIGKFIDYITSRRFENIKYNMQNLTPLQQENFEKLVKLIDKSNKFNVGFLHFSLSNEDRLKLDWLGC